MYIFEKKNNKSNNNSFQILFLSAFIIDFNLLSFVKAKKKKKRMEIHILFIFLNGMTVF
jgi:hypothetical protein